jgi:hypothetical protein
MHACSRGATPDGQIDEWWKQNRGEFGQVISQDLEQWRRDESWVLRIGCHRWVNGRQHHDHDGDGPEPWSLFAIQGVARRLSSHNSPPSTCHALSAARAAVGLGYRPDRPCGCPGRWLEKNPGGGFDDSDLSDSSATYCIRSPDVEKTDGPITGDGRAENRHPTHDRNNPDVYILSRTRHSPG